jgi:hypothetical protein
MKPREASATRVDVDARVRAGFVADYGDAFRIAAVPGHRAREWAEGSLRGADRGHGLFAGLVWHGLLGLQLAAPGTPGTLVGWQIAVDEPDLFTVEADGRLLAGRMVFQACDTAVTWTTMLHYHRPVARPIWGAAAYAHRALTPRCLDAARRSLQRSIPDPDPASGEPEGARRS